MRITFRHRAVHILIFNHFGEILLQKRSPWKDRHPLLWDSSAAGHVEATKTMTRPRARTHGRTWSERKTGALVSYQRPEKTGQEFIMVYHGKHNGPSAFRAKRSRQAIFSG